MDINKLQCVVGSAEKDKPAVIRLFGSIDKDRCECFNEEFLWLEECVQPSKIVVLINSEGGGVIHGMGVFSVIQSSSIEVECIVEGIAASMASVIWTAGTRSYMRDYSILMIHNPFGGDEETDSAFKQQLTTIYSKRFGLSADKVSAIMNGKEGCDGTFFSAKEAVDAGILTSDYILKTSRQTRSKVKCQLDSVQNSVDMRKIMENVCAEVEENKLPELLLSIRNQNDKSLSPNTNINMNEEKDLNFSVVAAQLGMDVKAPSANVMAKITELLGVEAKLKDTQTKLNDTEAKFKALEIKAEGFKTQAENLQKGLDEAKASLSVYQEAEKAAKEAKIVGLVENAIKEGKIAEEAKEQWITMAQSNLEVVKSTLDSIHPREVISHEIAKDPANVEAAKEGMTTEEAKLQEKVNAVVGEKFAFKKLED